MLLIEILQYGIRLFSLARFRYHSFTIVASSMSCQRLPVQVNIGGVINAIEMNEVSLLRIFLCIEIALIPENAAIMEKPLILGVPVARHT